MRTVISSSLFFAAILWLFADSAQAQGHAQGSYSFDILVEGQPAPIYVANGESYVAGVFGAAYQIRVHNRTGRRVEAVVAVDGRDVVTGQPVNPRRHRGHLVSPWSTTAIAGFRSSSSSVATFRFSTIPQSYAWRTGTAWGIGTVRVWMFEEDAPQPVVVLPHGGPAERGRRSGAAPSALDGAGSAPRDMGTEYGEQRWSPVRRTHFRRRSHGASAVLGIRYQSHEALAAAGILRRLHMPNDVVVWGDGPYYPYWYEPHPYAPPPPGHPYH